MMLALQLTLIALACWFISGTALNFSKNPHWYVRIWDFPRTFVAAVAGAMLVVYVLCFRDHWYDWLLMAGLVFVIVRQVVLIYPYTPLARKAVKRSEKPRGDNGFRLVISNLLQENEDHDRWHDIIRKADADVIVAVELSSKWDAVLAEKLKDYPHQTRRPQDNYYGMAVYSRLPFDGEPEVKFLVQDDVPSIHADLKLKGGQTVRLHAIHPRPPEPIRDQNSAPRDAELVLLAKEIGENQRTTPTVVCGDLNDVAWSFTSQLFQRLSGLLDPRKGRGFYNSFSASSRVFRFPLDHVFISDEFRLLDLQRLPNVGSDHFPIYIELSCEPGQATPHQPESKADADDHEDAAEIVEEQVEQEQKGEEKGHVSDTAHRRGFLSLPLRGRLGEGGRTLNCFR